MNLAEIGLGVVHWIVMAHDRNRWRTVRFEVFTAVTIKNGVFWDVNAVWLL
jgi:membrane protein YdbS with pleckstrin-like domain